MFTDCPRHWSVGASPEQACREEAPPVLAVCRWEAGPPSQSVDKGLQHSRTETETKRSKEAPETYSTLADSLCLLIPIQHWRLPFAQLLFHLSSNSFVLRFLKIPACNILEKGKEVELFSPQMAAQPWCRP